MAKKREFAASLREIDDSVALFSGKVSISKSLVFAANFFLTHNAGAEKITSPEPRRSGVLVISFFNDVVTGLKRTAAYPR